MNPREIVLSYCKRDLPDDYYLKRLERLKSHREISDSSGLHVYTSIQGQHGRQGYRHGDCIIVIQRVTMLAPILYRLNVEGHPIEDFKKILSKSGYAYVYYDQLEAIINKLHIDIICENGDRVIYDSRLRKDPPCPLVSRYMRKNDPRHGNDFMTDPF